jgi:hypothetical protein
MSKNHFLICSTTEECDCTFWNATTGTWLLTEEGATRYDRSIFAASSYPRKMGAIIEKNERGQDVELYVPVKDPIFAFEGYKCER